jgi:hypothetical protein
MEKILKPCIKASISLLLLCLCSCTSKFQGYGNWANDIVGDTDQQFTNGFEIGVQIPEEALKDDVIAAIYTLPSLRVSNKDPKDLTGLRVAFKNEMWTPEDLRDSEIIEDENPYGGVTSIMITKVSEGNHRRIEESLETGVSGSWSGSGDLQKFVHDDLGFGVRPAGWRHQIGAEPVVNYQFSREIASQKKSLFKLEFLNSDGQVLRVGNKYTDIKVFKSLKLGHNVPVPGVKTDGISVYFESRPYVRAVAHNIYLDGAVFADNEHTVESNWLVGGISNGIAIEKGNYSIRFDYHIQSPEYGDSSHIHKFGIISFGVKW